MEDKFDWMHAAACYENSFKEAIEKFKNEYN